MFAISAPEPRADLAVGRSHPITTLPTITDMHSGASPIRVPSYLGDTNPVSDPLFDISLPVADVLAHPKSDGSLSPVPPRIQRLDRDVEEAGKILGGEKAVVVVHGQIIGVNPFTRMSDRRHFDHIQGRLVARPWSSDRRPGKCDSRELEGS